MKDNIYIFYSISSLIFLLLGFLISQIKDYWNRKKRNYENEIDYLNLSEEVGDIKIKVSSLQKDMENVKTESAVNNQIIEDINERIFNNEKSLQSISSTIVQKMDNIFTKMDDRLYEIKDNVQNVDKKIDEHIAYHKGQVETVHISDKSKKLKI